jgi:acyl-CoA reductase-like NAD-dependent aldehyde dehydrogenase
MGAAQQGTSLTPAGAAAGRIVSINPATGEQLGEVPELGEAEVRAQVARARAAAGAWALVPLGERCRQVVKFAEVLMARVDEVIELLSQEAGKTRQEALGMEVMVVADLVRYFTKHAPEILADEPVPLHLLKHRGSYLHYVPRGVIGIIAPWNFPFAIPMGEALMAVIAGNAAVIKPSEITPLIALKAKELFDASGLPPDLLQIATGRGGTGAALLDAGIDYCVFTGSVTTGRKVAAACGERLIPCTLELGGKAPAVVCADADLDRAANAIAWGGFANSGQVCASVERVYVVRERHDELVRKVVAIARTLRQGDASSDETLDIGAMSWDRQLEHVATLVEHAVAAGARIEHGGQRPAAGARGMFYPPTVLSNVRHDMEIVKKEIFGPVIPIIAVADEDEAVRLANDSHLGLLAYVFCKDRVRAKALAERIEAGTVMVNDVLATYAAPETPWGGVKQSGIGRTHSAHGLRDLCQVRHINYDRVSLGAREIWWYPYKTGTYKVLLKAAKMLFGRRFWQR